MSVVQDFQVSGVLQSVVSGLGSTVKYFPRPNVSSGNQVLLPSATNATGQLGISNALRALFGGGVGTFGVTGGKLAGQMFRVVLAGQINQASGGTSQVSLYANNGSLFNDGSPANPGPSYTQIASTGAQSGNQPFMIEAEISMPFVGPLTVNPSPIVGQYSAMFAGAFHNTNNTNPWVVLDSPENNNPFFVVGVTFGTSNSANSASLYQFQILDE
jgi:hypothetical protein